MSSGEKIFLKWDDFQKNIASSIGVLREDQEFMDVTLVCEDGRQVDAHKVILAASSPFLKSLLGKNDHTHPMIFLRGVKSETLRALVHYVYFGKTSVLDENLEDFLNTGMELQIKGLAEWRAFEEYGKTMEDDYITSFENLNKVESSEMMDSQATNFNATNSLDKFTVGKKDVVKKEVEKKDIVKKYVEKKHVENKYVEDIERKNVVKKGIEKIHVEMEDVVKKDVEREKVEKIKLIAKGYPTNIEELDLQIKSLMSVGKTSWMFKNYTKKKYACNVCGKEDYYSNLKRHIEFSHIDGINIPCSLCGKMHKTRLALKNHEQACKNVDQSISRTIYRII